MRVLALIVSAFMAAIVYLCPLTGFANTISEIQTLIRQGHYEQARIEAIEMHTGQGYALAAQALSSQIMLGEVEKQNKSAKDAHELAKKALELLPVSAKRTAAQSNASKQPISGSIVSDASTSQVNEMAEFIYEAELQYALTYGFITRSSSNLTAWRRKLPSKSHKVIQDFRANYPNDARAIALDAAWHFGIIRKTGEKSGQKWFGASIVEGQALYEKAMALAPQDIIIRTNYIMAVLTLKTAPDHALIAEHLDIIKSLTPQSDVEQKVYDRAVELYRCWEAHKDCQSYAEDFLDGKNENFKI